MSALRVLYQSRNLSPDGRSGLFVLAWILAGLGLFSLPAEAARLGQDAAKPSKERVLTLAAKDPEATPSVQTDEDSDPYCASARKRLFVEGEGWIVRRVTTCY